VVTRSRVESSSHRWQVARRLMLLIAGLTALIAVSVFVVGPWQIEVFGLRLLSVTNPVKPFTFSLVLGLVLTLTSTRLVGAYATKSVLGFYVLSTIVMWILSLGPAPSMMGKPLMYRGPYALLMLFPGFNALRVPARFWMVATLCLAIVGALLFERLAVRLGRQRIVAAVLVSLGVIADGWVSDFPLVPVPAAWAAERCAGAATDRALMALPLGRPYLDVAAMYRSMSHGRPVVNGYSGYFPPHYSALRFGLALRDADVLTQLASHGVGNVVVNAEQDPEGVWRKYLTDYEGAELVCTEGGQTLYRLRGVPVDAPMRQERLVPIALIRANVNNQAVSNMTDGDRSTRWESGPQSDRTAVEIDLGGRRSVSAIELWLGPFVEDFPRVLAIDASGDGSVWSELWQGGSAGRAFVAAFRAPRDVPLRYDLPPTSARFLRLRTLANDDTYYWSVAELRVLESQ
jgi:hypothetical protein